MTPKIIDISLELDARNFHMRTPAGFRRDMQFEVEVHKNELGEWVAVAVAWNVQATGQTENEALARMMEALSRHFKASKPK